MYEKNADIMDSLRNAKDSVSDGAMRLLQKLKGSSQNDVDNAVSSQLPLADKATKLLGEGGRKFEDKAPSALSYIPGIGGYLGGLSKPTPGRGRFVSALGEGVSGNFGGMLGGASGAFGGAALGGIGALLAKVLSKGRINLGREAILGGAIPGGMVGNSLGTHAGAGLFHDMAAKSAEHKDSAASGLAYVPGVGGSLDGFFNPIPGRGRLVSAMGEGQMASRFGASSGLLGGMGGATVGTAGALLALLLSKGKLNPRASLALGLGGPLGGAAAGGLVGNSIGTHAGANLFREMAAKEGSWANAASSSINTPNMPLLPPKAPNPYPTTNKHSAKADAGTLQKMQRDLEGMGGIKDASQDNCYPSRSAAGDSKGVKYKQQTEDHATGTAAFDSLDKYIRMSKKAGLNDFQTNFFGRLIQEGRNEHEMYEAVKQAGDQFGAEVGKELNRGLKKLGFAGLGAIGKGLMTGAKALWAGAGKGLIGAGEAMGGAGAGKAVAGAGEAVAGAGAGKAMGGAGQAVKGWTVPSVPAWYPGAGTAAGDAAYLAKHRAGNFIGLSDSPLGRALQRVSGSQPSGLEKLSNWGAIGKGLMTAGRAAMGNSGNIAKIGVGGGALAAGAGAGYGAANTPKAVQKGVENVGNNAINSASNFMGNAANSAGNFMGNVANSASNFMGNAMGNSQQNGDTMPRVRSNIPEPTGNQYHAVRSNIPESTGNPLQNMASTAMQHFGNMANGAMGMMGGAAANGAGQQNLGFNPLQYMPGAGGAFNGANKVNGLGGGFTGNGMGMGKQSREKQAWVGKALATAAKYLGTGVARPGAAVKSVFDTARNAYGPGPLAPSISRGIKGVLNDPTMRSQMWTGAGTGATNPFTGAFTPSDDPNAGWGDYAARVGGSALAGMGAGLLGGKGTQDVMKRMYAGSLAGSTADLGAGFAGIDTGGLGGKAGFLGAGASPAKMPKWLGARANRFAGGYDPVDMGMGFTMPGRQGDTVTALSKLDPFSLVGKGYTKFVKPNVRPALDAMKANKGLTAGIGLGTAGIGTGAYIGNKAVSGINNASERMNAQMNMLRNETHNNLSGIREDMSGGMGGIGQFFNENKHWLMPALLAGGGALAGGALGGQSGAAMGGLSLPALYMMHQNGMFGGGGAANPLQAPPAKADYAQRKQQHEQELIDDYIARRNQDPRLAGPIRTPTPPMPYMGTGVMPNMPPKPKTAGDRAVRLMRHFAKN